MSIVLLKEFVYCYGQLAYCVRQSARTAYIAAVWALEVAVEIMMLRDLEDKAEFAIISAVNRITTSSRQNATLTAARSSALYYQLASRQHA